MHVERDVDAEEGALFIPEGDYYFLPPGSQTS